MDAEEVESRLRNIEDRLSKLESAAVIQGRTAKIPGSSGLEAKLIENADKIKTQDMIIISLKQNGKQTKEEIKKTLQDWGKVYGNWFDGGNFNGRLVKKNIVRSDGKNEENEGTFSLTKRGDFVADELIEKVMADR